jgi:thioredoxin 1
MDFFRRLRGEKSEHPEAEESQAELRQLTGDEFDRVVLKSEVPAVVDFWAEWCGPCHRITGAVQQLASEYEGRALVAKLNADDYPEVLGRYGIMGIPTLIYFKDGKEVDRAIGLTSYGTLKSKLERVLG